MARRNNRGVADDLIGITARMPWWVGVALAVVSYLVLHAFAQRPLPEVVQPGKVADLMSVVIWQGLATGGQYLLPFIFLIGAAVSALKRREALLLHATAANRSDAIASMTWPEFEVLVGEYFRRQGFTALDNGGGGPDGGVDVMLQKGSDHYLVQCPHGAAPGPQRISAGKTVLGMQQLRSDQVSGHAPGGVRYFTNNAMLLIATYSMNTGAKGQFDYEHRK